MDDLKAAFDYITKQTKVATSYHLADVPTNTRRTDSGFEAEQKQLKKQGKAPLYKVLMESGFRNLWETGVSQASAARAQRGAVEEQMGYAAALHRTGGTMHDMNDPQQLSRFDPKTPAEMPRYAATIAAAQNVGPAQRYGTSYIVWKDKVRDRATWTPGDSWSTDAFKSVKNYVGLNCPALIFAHAEEGLVRLFLAEATGKDPDWLAKMKPSLTSKDLGGAYVETQLHGALSWTDVAEVVVDARLEKAAEIKKELEDFGRAKGFDFRVRLTT
jgi:hypothetical protein